MPDPELFREANRQLTICNSCRYCEGYCPVFRAIETRRDFANGDIQYLANLCHDCRACFYACMYAPPHEFAINIPKMLSEARVESYRRLAWPGFLSHALRERRIEGGLAVTAMAFILLLSAILISPSQLFSPHLDPGSFYRVVPYAAIVIGGIALFLYWVCVWTIGGVRFWLEADSPESRQSTPMTLVEAVSDALSLNYLGGGGPGCYYPKDRPSFARRLYHELTFWGFVFALISTSLAAIYQDAFHWLPPFSIMSAPVVFGTSGGVAMIIGTIGLIRIKFTSDAIPAGTRASSMDLMFLAMLCLTSSSGLLTLAFRSTSAMGSLLVIHLGLVAALFITAPYGKFVHVIYRFLALVKYRNERSRAY